VLGLAAAANSKDRPAGDCRFDILDRQKMSHQSASPHVACPRVAGSVRT
jgi:hypothetical protein